MVGSALRGITVLELASYLWDPIRVVTKKWYNSTFRSLNSKKKSINLNLKAV